MKIELIVALVSGAVALATAAGTIVSNTRNTKAIELLKREREVFNFREPLARSAYDLQSRLYNILKQELVPIYLVRGNQRERDYVVNNTAFLVAQYFCWTEMVRREIQFIDLGEDDKTRKLLSLQDNISVRWGTDGHSRLFRIFAGEQRAIGEALIRTGARGPECMGYGVFLTTFNEGASLLIDALRTDIVSLGNNMNQAAERLTRLQNGLIDLLKILDPDDLRFPKERKSKV